MKIHAIITEAEQNLAKKKIDQHLSQLSNKDLVSLLPLLKESLIEGSEDMAQQKQEGKRIFGGSANFIAYDDKSKTAQRFKDTPKGLEVTAVQYKPDNDPRRGATFNAPSDAEIKSAMKQDSVSRTPAPTPEPEIKQIVQNSKKSEIEALSDAVAKELEMRKVGQKQSSNTESNPKLLKKVLTALLAGGLLAGAYGLGNVSGSSSSLEKIDQLQATIQQYEQSDLPNADAKIKELTSQIQTIQSTLDDTSAKYDQEKMDWEKSKTELENQKAEAEKESAEYASQLSTLQKQEIARQNQELENIETRKSQKAEKDGDTVSLTPQQKLSLKLLKSGLKDPDSVKFSAVKLIKFDDGSELITGWMNAKNSFGGYTSGGMFLTTPTGLPNVGYDGKPSIWSGEGQWDRDSLKPWETPLVGIMADGQYKDIQSDRLRTVMELYMDPKAVAEFNAKKSTIKKGHQIDIDAIPKVISSEYISVDGSQLDEIRKLAGLA